MPTTLYQKYRPKRFDQIVGQQHVVKLLQAQIVSNNISHAYIFIGPRGTGKTTTARIFATAINCQNADSEGNPCGQCDICKAAEQKRFLDLIEIDAASNRGIDNIRQLQEGVNLAPAMGRYKVYVIDEVHMLTKEAFNALLKTLEEPPKHVVFILATTEPHKVLPTIMSRCERYVFHLASREQLLELLDRVAEQEGVTIEDRAKDILVTQAKGSYRDLLSALDPIFSVAKAKSSPVTYKMVTDSLGLADEYLVANFLQAVFKKDLIQIKKQLEEVVAKSGNIQAFIATLIDRLEQDSVEFLETQKLPEYAHGATYDDLIKFLTFLAEYHARIRLFHSDKLALYLSVFNFLADSTSDNGSHNTGAWQNNEASVKEDMVTDLDSRKTDLQQGGSLTSNDANSYNAKQPSQKKDSLDRKIMPINGEDIADARKGQKVSTPSVAAQLSSQSPELTLSRVKELWPQVLSQIKRLNLSLYSIFTTCAPISVAKNGHGVVNIIVQVRFEYHKQKISSANVQQALRNILKGVFGVEATIVPQLGRGATIDAKSVNNDKINNDKTISGVKTSNRVAPPTKSGAYSTNQTSPKSNTPKPESNAPDVLKEVFGDALML